ncbi:MAG TPA: ABC transporter transmembrane domain-containing protein [Xanthobacteraceae bacterium]
MTSRSDQQRSGKGEQERVPTVPENPVHASLARIAKEFDNGPRSAKASPLSVINEIVEPETSAEACLAPTLALFGWAGEGRRIREALPHFDRIGDIEGLRSVLDRLGYGTSREAVKLSAIRSDTMPCLFSRDGVDAVLIVERDPDGTLLAFAGDCAEWQLLKPNEQSGWAFPIWDQSVKEEPVEQGKSWLLSAISQFKPVIGATIALSFLGNLAALTIPIFVIFVYDLGIGTKSTETVVMLAVGASIVIAVNLALRAIRARAMAYFGARIDALIGMQAFEVILNMPISMIETAPVGTQISRLKQFESMRDSFTGTLAASVIDIPFIFIFLLAIALWGGHLVWVPLSLVAVYAALAAITMAVARSYVRAISVVKQRRHLLLHEIVEKRRTIRALNAEKIWIARHRDLVETIARLNYRAQRFNNFVQNLGELLVSIAGIATLGFGALRVTSGTMTSGALIGTMALVWRVLSPLQSTYLSLPRLEQALQTFQQIDRLMKIRSERSARLPRSFFRKFKGRISIQRLAFRYPQRPEAVLRSIQLEIKPGEMVAITGTSGAGKTTLLRLMAGLYPPTLGSVLVDNMDLRQIDPAEWRSQVAFLPESVNFFYGTLAQNIRLARPDASDAEVMRALAEMGFDADGGPLTEGLDQRLKVADFDAFPDALRQRLALARCFIKNAPLFLLDNPATGLDSSSEQYLIQKFGSLKGRSTVVFTTFRPSHMRLADRVVLIKDGQVALDGPPEKVIERATAAA